MKILVFGLSGQVAIELAKISQSIEFDLVFLGRHDADLIHPNICENQILKHKPDAVINAAAWTNVDQAENHIDQVYTVNGDSPGIMARTCSSLSIPFIHISSDYVFDGSGNIPWKTNDALNPISVYGKSKLYGEQLILQSKAKSIILRTSWVFSSHGSNFVKTIIRIGNEKDSINVVGDQVGGPTSAHSIAQTIIILTRSLLNGHSGGVFHFSGTPNVSWATFAAKIKEYANLKCKINEIPSSDYPTEAPRPFNSRLDCELLTKNFGILRPDWPKELKIVIDQLKETIV